jgi:cytochrome b561
MTITLIVVAVLVVARVGWRLYRTRQSINERSEQRWR